MVFSGGVSFLRGLSVFRYPFQPRVTAVARKDPGHSRYFGIRSASTSVGGEREEGGGRERDRDRQTDRDTETQTDRQRQTHRETETDRDRGWGGGRERDRGRDGCGVV